MYTCTCIYLEVSLGSLCSELAGGPIPQPALPPDVGLRLAGLMVVEGGRVGGWGAKVWRKLRKIERVRGSYDMGKLRVGLWGGWLQSREGRESAVDFLCAVCVDTGLGHVKLGEREERPYRPRPAGCHVDHGSGQGQEERAAESQALAQHQAARQHPD